MNHKHGFERNDQQSTHCDDTCEASRVLSSSHQPSFVSYASFNSERLPSIEVNHTPMRKLVGDELVRLSQMSGPLFLQNIFSYSSSVVAVAFVGHLGDASLLSSAVLANSLYNVSGYSVVSGLSAGMESLCGQAYGACSYKTLGLVLQRALLITWLVCLPISLLWANAEPLMLALGQQPSIARGAASYLWHITPTLFTGALVECLKRYLLAQRVVVPGMITTIITSCLSPLYNWLLVFRYQLGLTGAAYAFVLSQGTQCLMLLAYTVWRDASMAAAGDEQATWPRPGPAVFQGWIKYLSYGVPAAAMICMEWWAYEVVIMLAGIAPNAEVALGVMGLCFQISAMAYMSAMAYGSSVNTRVSNELGAGQASAARLSVITGIVVVLLVQVGWAVACWCWGRQVIGLLSSNEEVVGLTLKVLPILLPTFVTDAVNCVCMGVLRGAGRPGIGAILNIISYWGVGVPLSGFFGLHLNMSVTGFWLGLLITSAGQNVVQLLVLSRFDWHKEVERAAVLMAEHDEADADIKAGALGSAAAAAAAGQDDLAPLRDAAAAGSVPDTKRAWHAQSKRWASSKAEGSGRGSSSDSSSAQDAGERVALLGDRHGKAARALRSDVHEPSRLGPSGLRRQQQQQQLAANQQGHVQQHAVMSSTTAVTETSSSGSEQSPLLDRLEQQHIIQQQGSLQKALLQSCDSIDKS